MDYHRDRTTSCFHDYECYTTTNNNSSNSNNNNNNAFCQQDGSSTWLGTCSYCDPPFHRLVLNNKTEGFSSCHLIWYWALALCLTVVVIGFLVCYFCRRRCGNLLLCCCCAVDSSPDADSVCSSHITDDVTANELHRDMLARELGTSESDIPLVPRLPTNDRD